MRYTLIGMLLGLFSIQFVLGADRQHFDAASDAAQYIRDVLHERACGTAISAINDAIAQHGVPADVLIDDDSWLLQWTQTDGILYMVMINQSRDIQYETCISYYIMKPYE